MMKAISFLNPIRSSFCTYINNQAYLFAKIPSKDRATAFLTNPKAFSNKDITAILLTLSHRPKIARKISSTVAEQVNPLDIEHKELSIIAAHLAENGVENKILW